MTMFWLYFHDHGARKDHLIYILIHIHPNLKSEFPFFFSQRFLKEEIINIFSTFYGNTRESSGKLTQAVETRAPGERFHSMFSAQTSTLFISNYRTLKIIYALSRAKLKTEYLC